MKLVCPDQRFSSISSTWERYSAFFVPSKHHPRMPMGAPALLQASCWLCPVSCPGRSSAPRTPPASDPGSALYNRGILSVGTTTKGEGEELASTWSVSLWPPPPTPASRGAVPWMRPGGRPSVLARLGCENPGSDVVGEGAEFPCSSSAMAAQMF